MGNCCGGSSNEGEVSILRGGVASSQQLHSKLFDDREILGLRGAEKIRLIVRIQSLFRGGLARRKVRQRYGLVTKALGGGYGMVAEPNYHNPKVQEIKERLGEFEYGSGVNDGVKRVRKGMMVLENGAQYEGEWNEHTGKRDGRGY